MPEESEGAAAAAAGGDPNSLEAWFPKLAASGVRVPRTAIVRTDLDLVPLLDGVSVDGFGALVESLDKAVSEVGGYPVFLRTGLTSGKHEWARTCQVASRRALPSHIAALVEWSNVVDFFGLATDVWVVREMLELEASFSAFEQMPVAREFRCFIRDGEVECIHPYWPASSIRRPSSESWREQLEEISRLEGEEEAAVRALAGKVAKAFPGYWSLDFTQEAGSGEWIAIDMAVGEQSFHMPGCEISGIPPEVEDEALEIDWKAFLTEDGPAEQDL